MSGCRIADVARSVARAFPVDRAEEWDNVGLLVGDPAAAVTGVLVGLDPTVDVIEEAHLSGANVVVTHHPAYLKPPRWITPGRGSAGVVFAAASNGVALICAHTNLDRDAEAQGLLPNALDLEPIKPIERSLQPRSLVTAYAPASCADDLVAAMSGAGAGQIGVYDHCSFSATGIGSFHAPSGSSPSVGRAGESSSVDEVRIEMVCPTWLAQGVVSAAVAAHPYEEPLVTAAQIASARNSARLGMLSACPDDKTLRELVARCAKAFDVNPRVWGDVDAPVRRVATATGSAGSLIGDALAAGADVLVAGEVRYHDALDALHAGLCVVELGHDVSEWPLVALLERAVRSTEGISDDQVRALIPTRAWWTS